MATAAPGTLRFDHAVGARALHDAPHSGDAHLVLDIPDGLLVSVVDGLGHGPDAAAAAQTALAALRAGPKDVQLLLRHCHEALRGTRGVVMTLAIFEARRRRLSWVGVGNVDS